ncbi:MAG: hypothetical protein ACYCVL_01435 [Gemmatimonadaceae bacterium]
MNDQSAVTSNPRDVGPNGYRVEILENGDQVEWIPDEEDPGNEWPLLLMRGRKSIINEYEEHWDKVSWDRQQKHLDISESEEAAMPDDQREMPMEIRRGVERVEKKYGIENLGWDDFGWGLLCGRMSALAWVLGSEWDASVDT